MKLRLLLGCVFAGCLLLFSGAAWADGISIQNASFEATNPLVDTCAGCGSWNYGPIPGWTLTGSGGSFEPTSTTLDLPLPNGSIVAFSNGGSISQNLGVTLLPDSIYTLSVFVGDRLDAYHANYSLALMAGSTTLCTFSGSDATIGAGLFANETCTYKSGATVPSGDLSIVLTSAGAQADFDNVSLNVTSVPEPTSLALMAAGLVCAALLTRCLKA